jgi:hypothetical protein
MTNKCGECGEIMNATVFAYNDRSERIHWGCVPEIGEVMGKRLVLHWREEHTHMEVLNVDSKGRIMDMGRAMEAAIFQTGLGQRHGILPETISFTIEEDGE